MSRLVPLKAYSKKQKKVLDKYVFRRGQPLPLFSALAHSETVLKDLDNGTSASIEEIEFPLRLREILILRTLARWGARAEWDVHVLLYAPIAKLTEAEIENLGGNRRRISWASHERLLIDLADALKEHAQVPDNLWDALAHAFDEKALSEILMIATQYVKIALLNNALKMAALTFNSKGE